jgi:patatin-related protein
VSPRHQVSDDDLEDVRIALVMSGGISLAVWIGGVATEIHAVSESHPGQGGVYGDLLDITRSSLRVDVITGTSAGGLNGGFLALASAYGTSMAALADLWIDKGAFGRLLRSPSASNPPSLLRGDDYFLPELREAFVALRPSAGVSPRPPARHPIHLAMTTTLLTGDVRRFSDDHGTDIIEEEHRGTFTFRRDHRTDPAATDGPRADPFIDPAVIERLALAARSTASFPFLFEPSRVPIGGPRGDLHPDMADIVDFAATSWVLDGGVLVNRPVDLALRAVFDRPASRQVRRHLLYVDPNPTRAAEELGEGDDVGSDGVTSADPDDSAAPSLRTVLIDSLVTLPRAQSLAQTFEDLRRHNERVAHQQALRLELVDLTDAEAGGLDGLASTLWPAYRRERVRGAIGTVLEIARATSAARRATSSWWSAEEIRRSFEEADRDGTVPFIPHPAALGDPGSEGWGIDHLERLAYLCLDVFQRAIRVAPLDAAPLRAAIRDLRGRLHDELFALPALRADEARFWDAAVAALPASPDRADERSLVLRRWLDDQLSWWPLPPAERRHEPGLAEELVRQSRLAIEQATGRIVELLVEALPILRDVGGGSDGAPPGEPPRRANEERAAFARLLGLLAPPGIRVEGPADLSQQLHRVEVVHLMLAGEVVLEQPIRVMQVDGGTPNSFGGPETIERKLTGSRLGHAAAFYKASWRANDWLWGRLDGATRLAQLVLDPVRLDQLGYTVDDAVAVIRRAAVGPGADDTTDVDDATDEDDAEAESEADRRELAERFDEAACREELRYLDDPGLPTPLSLPVCAMQVARRRHLQILREDLGRIASGVETDLAEGARRGGAGPTFRDAYQRVLDAGDGRATDVPAAELFSLMASSEIGADTIADDAGSGLYVGSASRAAAVGVATLDARTSGLGPVRILTRPLRLFLLVYATLVVGATRLGRVGRILVAVALTGGAALVAVALLRDDVPLVLAGAGSALIAGGIVVAALRARAGT